MPESFGNNRRIRLRLGALTEREPALAPVEHRARLFAATVRSLMLILDRSPAGRALTRFATLHDVSVGLDPLLEPHACYFYPAQNHFDLGYQPDLLQQTEKGVSRYLVSFAGGLRRAWHHHGGRGADVSLRPEDFLLLARCAEADIGAVTHLIAWELRLCGLSFLWRHLLSGPDGDMTVVFERAIAEHPPWQFDGRALKAAFDQWFAERERTGTCDHAALEAIDLALIQHQGAIGVSNLRREYLQNLGLLPNGSNYLRGCLFSGAWYEGPNDDFNLAHLRHIEQDIQQLFENQSNYR
jgi:hypothetical protein